MIRCAYLGIQEYYPTFALQCHLRRLRKLKKTEDICLILQHPPLITIGRRGFLEHLCLPPHYLTKLGLKVVKTNRGGLLTYHGPGQLVSYFIVDLLGRSLKVRGFVNRLEDIMINTLKDLDIKGLRSGFGAGVWVDNKKIGSVGINLSQGVSIHGLALNVSNDLKIQRYLRACGLEGVEQTSIACELEDKIDFVEVLRSFEANVKKAFP